MEKLKETYEVIKEKAEMKHIVIGVFAVIVIVNLFKAV